MAFLKSLYTNFEEYLCSLFVGIMILCLIIQVILRMTIGSSLAWTEELSRYSFLWAVYVGAALAIKRSGQVRITAQFSPMSVSMRLFFRFLADLIWIGFNIFIAIQSWDVIQEGLVYPEVSPTLGVVKAWVEMIIPASFVLMSWRIVEQYYTHWRNGTLPSMVRYEEEIA